MISTLASRSFRPRQLLQLLALCGALNVSAADKNGVSPSAISLPGGPGSIEGLGESFQPTLNTGTAKYGIQLTVSPGTAGHQPGLALRYEGGAGNGPLGYGWSLPIPFIQRRSDEGIPAYGRDVGFPREDTFINDAREELVPSTNGFYFCENEGAFVRYRRVGDHWEGTSPDGRRMEFGVTPQARITAPPDAFDEEAASPEPAVFSWLLEREIDTHGNVIEYRYATFPGDANANQKYLAGIRYGPGAPPWSHFHFVTFDYEDREDWFEDCRAGFPIRTGKRLHRVVMGTQGMTLPHHAEGDFNSDGQPDFLNRRYDLTYLPNPNGDASFQKSLLASVTLVGADGVTALPPETFDYAVSNPPETLSAANAVLVSENAPAAVMDNPLVDLIDLNGDGLPDLLKTESDGGAHSVALNLGPANSPNGPAIRWADPIAVDPGAGAAWNFDLASERTHLADMNGDGLADLVHKSADDAVFYFANTGARSWSARQDMALEGAVPPAPFGVPGARAADIDFDKRMDVIQSVDAGGETAYRVWYNLGAHSYTAPVATESVGNFDLSLPTVHVADLNGDRVPDVVRIQPGAAQVCAGLGYGRFATARAMVIPDLTLDDEQAARARLIDINGDSLADLVLERAAPGVCWYWLNRGNYEWDPRRQIIDLPPAISADAAVRWADLNGDGATDLIYADSLADSRLVAVDMGRLISGGVAPNLLTRIANGIGRVTHIEYAPSTRFALADAAAGNPWPDPLPFPVTVVSAVRVNDSLGHEYRTEFSYHDGYYDPAEKQFRGFARVEQKELGDDSAPTLVSRSHFDTGREFDAMKGRLLRATAETEDGRVFWDEVTAYAIPPRTLGIGTNGQAVVFAHPVSRVRSILELGQGEPRVIEAEMEYDDYGNETRLANHGIVEGDNRSAFDDERIVTTSYAINNDAWIVNLPSHRTVADENGVVISRSAWFYDDETFSGDNPGAVTRGNLTLLRDWIDPADDSAFVDTTRTRYDAWGNAVATMDPLWNGDPRKGHFREMAYDPEFHVHVVSETIHIGDGKPALVFQARRDPGLATLVESIDFNGHATQYHYDALGRLVSAARPGDSSEFPTVEYSYVLAHPAPCWPPGAATASTGMVNYVETRRLDRTLDAAKPRRDHYLISRQFTDGLGRPLMTRAEAASREGAPQVAVTGAFLYNARQKAARALQPFFTSVTGSLDDLLEFENIEAPDWTGWFHDDGALKKLALDDAHKTSTEYDATLRVTRVVNPDGSSSRTLREPLVAWLRDENDDDPASPHFNTPRAQQFDGLGRIIKVTEFVRLTDDGAPAAEVQSWNTFFAYDLNNRLTRVVDAQNNLKIIRHDGLGRAIAIHDPNTGSVTNIYDAASNLVEAIDAKGQRVRYAYDGVNRVVSEDLLDDDAPGFSYKRSPDVIYHYDLPAGPVDAGDGTHVTARNTRGLLAYVEDPSGEEHTSYDARGRVEWTIKRVPDPILSTAESPLLVSWQSAFEYDSQDRVTRVRYPDNDEVRHAYDARGQLARVFGDAAEIITGIDYAPSGQKERVLHGNGVETRHAYDARARLTRLRVTGPDNSGDLIHLACFMDPASNIQRIEDRRAGLPSDDPRRNGQAYAYDNLYRLTRVQYLGADHSPGPNELHFRHDRIGNMLALAGTLTNLAGAFQSAELNYGGPAGRWNRAPRNTGDPAGPQALTALREANLPPRAFSYDANGNMENHEGVTCVWDFRNRLVAATNETLRADYRYDHADRRVSKRVALTSPPSAAGQVADAVVSTLYIGKHFEVREHGEPVKFIFNGASRVARVTGSLSSNPRVQRIRLREGWNLVALAVDADPLLAQINASANPDSSAAAEPLIRAAYRWDPATTNYVALNPIDAAPAGSVLWIEADRNAVVAVRGAYADPAARSIAAGGGFLPGAGMEPWRLDLPEGAAAWQRGPLDGAWRPRLPDDLAFVNDLPSALAPGEALFVSATEALQFDPPDPALRIRYYHQDHLGSSSVITDAQGALVEETAFLPYGEPRHQHQPRELHDPYQFARKERDDETGLHYFEARYLAGALARFMSPDPKFARLDQLAGEDLDRLLANPQKLNLYAYALNNPVAFADPTGLDEKETVSTIVSVGGFAADVADGFASGGFLVENTDNLVTAVARGNSVAVVGKVAGTTLSAASFAMKGAEFIADPSLDTGAMVAWEGEKWALTAICAPAGLAFQALDLTGYGPGAIFESIEKSTQAARRSAQYHRQAAAAHQYKAQVINQAAPRIAAQHRHAGERLQALNDALAKQKEHDAWVASEIKRLEALNKETMKEVRRLERRVRELYSE